MPWDAQQIARYPRLTDSSPEAEHVRLVAKTAYEEKYQRAVKWDELNPQVRDHWVEITAAVMATLQEMKS